MSIMSQQTAIITEFAAIPTWEDRYRQIIAIGRQLPELPETDRTEAHRVRGCASNVWLIAEHVDHRVIYRADSDALIVRGLIALLLRVFSGQPAAEILRSDPAFIEELGLNTHLSANRANGLTAMVRQIKAYALAFTAVT